MEQFLSIHIKNFNNRVKVMNQTQAKELVLSASDARNLHNDLFNLLTQLAELTAVKKESSDDVTKIEFDGGGF